MISNFKKLDTLYSANYGTCPGFRDPFVSLFKDIQLIFHPSQITSSKNSALVIWGGEDISPSLYNHKAIEGSGPEVPTHRDRVEEALVYTAIEYNMPIIGICRGAELLCALAGGSLIQHVTGHSGTHLMVELKTGQIIPTNSYHHQMMNPFNIRHTLITKTLDPRSKVYKVDPTHPLLPGIQVEPEIVYFPEINGLAIQGHPEFKGPDGFLDYILNLTNRFLHDPSSL